ncbi:MAG: hypothetical protein ACOH17_10645 [Cellulomonas sp.]
MAEPTGTGLPTSAHGSRPVPMDREPGARLGKTLSLLEEVDRVAEHARPLLRTVDRMTGLPPAQVSALMIFAQRDQVRVGTARGSTALTALAHKGLVAQADPLPDGDPGDLVWRLTDPGRAALEQVQGLRIRAVGTLLNALDDTQVDALHAAVRAIAHALEDLAVAADDDAPLTQP